MQLFKKEGVTDAAGMLTNDPRSATWHAVVRNSGVAGELQTQISVSRSVDGSLRIEREQLPQTHV